ncbi:hydroxymethylpyrimidine/phosphomethylpyrimidine kinase [Halobellus sp. Atlit-38R]|uniref:bifunctional hydroxymethylpyrimidine kinase/phosphomethylpyrimidine kinase n=1 Tax=Halobellus sp. Atlit-38R TaxID=2282131 RepID=UPI000EF19D08|nr:bifunctional hydroxymethylpyrimidine kinase/phosphomethylpyrimidine kinase [Halobellus sp. Atlit-38R]RLM88129.1 hydroxymethylpyrimidine/phosphomethylpyrimidine kinase [Halobellus sp. Atlit-38R]
MTRADPQRPPYALTIASSDSSGGAGLQADLKTLTRLGAYGGSVVVAVTAQHTQGVESTHVLPPADVRAQFDAVAGDVDVDAVKLGMLATADAVRTVDQCLADYDGPVVIDPVMVATAGDRLLAADAVDAYTDLFARATLVTPNADETEAFTGIWPDGPESRASAAAQFFEWGADAVLFKGGHVHEAADGHADEGDEGGTVVRDVLYTAADSGTGDRLPTATFEHERIENAQTHGSGCTLASAITARVAHGDPLAEAVEQGVAFTRAAIERSAAIGGSGSVNHLAPSGARSSIEGDCDDASQRD